MTVLVKPGKSGEYAVSESKTTETIIVHDEWSAMRDGTLLHSTVTRPKDAGSLPVVLIRTPYLPFTEVEVNQIALARMGVAVVVQSVRGTGKSEGVFEPFIAESEDGYDAIQWCAERSWSSGEVVTFGRSYLALTQHYAQSLNPPALRAMSLEMVPKSPYNMVYPQRVFAAGMLLYWSLRHARASIERRHQQGEEVSELRALWAKVMSEFEVHQKQLGSEAKEILEEFPSWGLWAEHSEYDSWWAERERARNLSPIPTFYAAGWHDIFLDDTLEMFNEDCHEDSVLVVGPWAHTAMGAALGDVFYGFDASAEGCRLRERQLQFLLGQVGVLTQNSPQAKVSYFLMGSNRWVQSSAWPPEEVSYQSWFLHPDGSLSGQEPITEGSFQVVETPDDPVPTIGGANFFLGSDAGYRTGQKNQFPLDDRTDIVRFSSQPLTEEIHIVGDVTATLFVRTACPVTHWSVKLVDIAEDGSSHSVVDGICKAVCVEDDVQEIPIRIGATAHTISPGHRIRVDVAASNFPKASKVGSHAKEIEHSLILGPSSLSSLVLPVVATSDIAE